MLSQDQKDRIVAVVEVVVAEQLAAAGVQAQIDAAVAAALDAKKQALLAALPAIELAEHEALVAAINS